MKHWMAVAAIAVLATGISVANGMHDVDRVRTPGLPVGWAVDGFVAGVDEVGVDRHRDSKSSDLVLLKRADTPEGKPLTIYQIIDARPWRGRTIQFSSYTYLHMAPEVMRRIKGAKVTELHMVCAGGERSGSVSLDLAWHSRSWIEHNVPVQVPPDATWCRFGMTTTVRAELRLSRLRLKDYHEEREAWLERRRPMWKKPAAADTLFPARAATGVAAVMAPNLEFKQ